MLTIPQLIQNTSEKQLVSAFLKTHSVLSNAIKEAEVTEEIKLNKIANKEDFKRFLESHLKTLNECDYDVCLADGSKFDYDENFYTGCTYEATGASSALKESCIKLIVDVNGTKGPNKAGMDVYNMWVTSNGLIPEGETNSCENGLDCGAYVLAYHKLYDVENHYVYYSPITNCKTQENNECLTCNDGYRLANNKCTIIDDDPYCTAYSGEECRSCNGGYYLKSGACEQNPDFCSEVQDEGATCIMSENVTAKKINNNGTEQYVSTLFASKLGEDCPEPTSVVSIGCSGVSSYTQYQNGGNYNYYNDYYLGAIKDCQDKGMELPDEDELVAICEECKKSENDGACPTDGYYQSSTPVSSWEAKMVDFSDCHSLDMHRGNSGWQGVFCVVR